MMHMNMHMHHGHAQTMPCTPRHTRHAMHPSMLSPLLQMEAGGAPGFVEPERYELKAVHKQLRQTLCARCRAMTQVS